MSQPFDIETATECPSMSDFAWLIEAPGRRYLGTRRLGCDEFYWTQDHAAATRFVSASQAHGVMMAVREIRPDLFAFEVSLGDARPIEHAWFPRPAESSEGTPASGQLRADQTSDLQAENTRLREALERVRDKARFGQRGQFSNIIRIVDGALEPSQ